MENENVFRAIALQDFAGEPNKVNIIEQLVRIRKFLVLSTEFDKQLVHEQFRQCKCVLIMLLQTADGSIVPDLININDLLNRHFPNRLINDLPEGA